MNAPTQASTTSRHTSRGRTVDLSTVAVLLPLAACVDSPAPPGAPAGGGPGTGRVPAGTAGG